MIQAKAGPTSTPWIFGSLLLMSAAALSCGAATGTGGPSLAETSSRASRPPLARPALDRQGADRCGGASRSSTTSSSICAACGSRATRRAGSTRTSLPTTPRRSPQRARRRRPRMSARRSNNPKRYAPLRSQLPPEVARKLYLLRSRRRSPRPATRRSATELAAIEA